MNSAENIEITEEGIKTLINELQKYDNKEGYKLDYEAVKKGFGPIIKELINYEEKSLDYLYSLLKNEETWSCLFALEILEGIKNEKSVPYLVKFIEENEEHVLLKRSGKPEEIAKTAIFLCENDFVNGETILVDGGENIQ